MARKRRAAIRDGGIFPFVSVLFCTIGALTLLWAAGSLESAVEDPDLPKHIAGKEAELAAAEASLAEQRAELVRLDEAAPVTELRLDQLRRRGAESAAAVGAAERELADLLRRRDALRASTGDLAEVERARRAAEAALAETPARRAAAEALVAAEQERAALAAEAGRAASAAALARAERERIEAERARVTAARAELLARPPGARLVLTEAAGRTPVWIEVTAEGYRILGAGEALLPRERFLAENGPMMSVATGTQQGARYPVLLLRPGAHAQHHALAAWLRARRVAYAAEPVDAGWALHPEGLP